MENNAKGSRTRIVPKTVPVLHLRPDGPRFTDIPIDSIEPRSARRLIRELNSSYDVPAGSAEVRRRR